MTYHDWPVDSCLRLLSYGSVSKSFRNQLLAQGLTHGERIRIVRYAPLGGPVQIELRGAMIVIHRESLRAMQWERVL